MILPLAVSGIWASGMSMISNAGTFDTEDGNRVVFNGGTPQVINTDTGTFNSQGTITVEGRA